MAPPAAGAGAASPRVGAGAAAGASLDRLEGEREAVERQPVAQQRLDRGGGRRAAERVALHELDAEVAQPARLLARLDALGDDGDVHRARHRDDRAQDVAVALVLGDAVDELAVDLDRLDREALDVVERRVAGAEVVEHQPHAEALEVLQHGGRRGRLLHQDALGQLEPQALRRHAGLAQDAGELVGQRGLGELAAGEVDGQAGEVDRGVGGPARELAAGLAQHPAPERDDQPALLGDGDERAREHDALARVAPAHERLDGDDAALVEVDERLVVELELVALERAAQVVLELEALDHAAADRGVEELVARAARGPWRGTSRRRRRARAPRRRGSGRRRRRCRRWR